jgi:hypothetical protein
MKSEGATKTPHYARPIKVMTVREVSAYLHVHRSTIYLASRLDQNSRP